MTERPGLREATTADVPAIVDLVESAYRGERSRQGWDTEADLIDGRRTDDAMVRESLGRPDGMVLVLEDPATGRLVGCCELTGPDRPGGTVTLGMFAVEPGRQGAGLGGAVLGRATAIARDGLGAGRMELWVIDVRHRLIDWYRRRGFEPTGSTRPFPYGDERYGRPRRDDLRFAVLATDLDDRDERRPASCRLGRMDAPDTVVEALDLLKGEGYSVEFQLHDGHLSCDVDDHACPAEDVEVERLFRFEGPSDPGDEMVVFGLRDPVTGRRGVLASAFGPSADPEILDHVVGLATRFDRD